MFRFGSYNTTVKACESVPAPGKAFALQSSMDANVLESLLGTPFFDKKNDAALSSKTAIVPPKNEQCCHLQSNGDPYLRS
jgi:hypothetical protein